MRHQLVRRLGALAVVWVVLSLCLPTLGSVEPASAAPAVSAATLHLVGGPVSVGNRAVVLYLDASHNLHLAGVDPVSGHVIWQYAYSGDGVTPGVALTPISLGSIVLDVLPAGNQKKNPLVTLAGINATSGQMVWQGTASFLPTDAPSTCEQNKYFCIPGFTSEENTGLVLFDPTTGQGVSLLKGPMREIGPDLYETDANKDTLEQVSPSGTQAWELPVSTVYGPGYSPDDGWDIDPIGSLDVGTIEPVVKGNGYNVSDVKTLGIDAATGVPKWSLGADYQCGGALFFVDSPIACEYGGVTSKPGAKKAPSFKGLTVTLVGFNPVDGSVTWSLPVGNAQALLYGNGLALLDDTHMEVTLRNGQRALLDTTNGTTAPLRRGQTLWCQQNPNYTINVPKGLSYFADRTSTTLFYGCTGTGHASTSVPTTTPDSVGITVDGTFVWPGTHGLRTRVVGLQQSTA